MGSNRRVALILIAGAVLLPRDAVADQNFKTNSAIWSLRDKCTRQAQQAYPDYTPESNAKREKARQNCLRIFNMPAEETSVSPQQPMPGTPKQ